MATSVASVVSHFPEAENGFTTTTAGSVSSGAVTVTLNSVAGYTNGEPVVLVIDPTDAAKKQTFTGIVDTGGVQVTSVVWTAGTNQTHALGATVVDYATATHISMISKGIKVEHSQDGTHKAALITSRTADTAPLGADSILTYDLSATALKKVTLSDLFKTPPVTESTMSATDWKEGVLPAQSGTIVNNGNRSYDIPFASTVANILSPGMRLRTTRTVTAPTQCTDLEASSSQYFSATSASLAGMTFTDDFTCMGWVKLESYGSQIGVVSRRTGTTNGYSFTIGASGQVQIFCYKASVYDGYESYQSIPLGKWVHIAASLDLSGNAGEIYIDGVLVPDQAIAGSGALNDFTQSGDFNVGAVAAGQFFDGKIAQVAVFSSVLSASTIRSYMSQGLSGSESTLVSAFSCNNSLLDLNTTNNNDLTANGGALMTNADSPFGQDSNGVTAGTTDYELVMKVNGATATVQVPEGCTIPTSGGVSAVAYSTATSPFGFTLDKGRWKVLAKYNTRTSKASPVNATVYNNGDQFTLPVGPWGDIGYEVWLWQKTGTSGLQSPRCELNTSSAAVDTKSDLVSGLYNGASAEIGGSVKASTSVTVSAQTPYYLNLLTSFGGTTDTVGFLHDVGAGEIYAIPAGV